MISIIIPVLNEACTIESLLEHISENTSEINSIEILVVDGGSSDNTKSIVQRYSEKSPLNIKLMTSEKGRAKQMNTGAQAATKSILYFLHADSFPPKGFDQSIISEVEKGNITGCFRLKFDDNHPLLKFSEWFTRFNYKFCRGGDQSLFITSKAFNSLGGYNESYTIYEDCEFINRLYNQIGFTVINDHITTSSRKYSKNGTWKLQFHFTIIHLKKWMGASPKDLFNYYDRNIVS
jgi:rSAM/selenodomain-associated transferase 2